MLLNNKVAVVTGAARGIGRAIAVELATQGAEVYIVDLKCSEEVAAELASKGLKMHGLSMDISKPEEVDPSIAKVLKQHGKIDILVNNAGIIAREAFVDLSYQTWNKVLDVNVNGNFNLCKAVIPSMIEHKYGKILNISSIAGKMGDITASPVYGTSKGAVNAMTKSLARQLACYGINVNAIAPHAIESEMSAQWSDEKRKNVIDGIPLHRMGTPEDIAKASLYLVSDDSSFVTGEILNVNGGALMD